MRGMKRFELYTRQLLKRSLIYVSRFRQIKVNAKLWLVFSTFDLSELTELDT